MQSIRVVVVAFAGISPFHLSAPCVVFGEAHGAALGYRLQVCALEAGMLPTSAGFAVQASAGLEALDEADVVIIPSWQDAEAPVPPALLRALQDAAARGAMLVGLCLGAFVLAETGLLDGYAATTHWACATAFSQRYPRIRLQADRLYVEAGQLLTSAGTAAALDCCLHLVRRQHGQAAAAGIARYLVTPPHRQGGQAQYIAQPLPANARDGRLAGLLDTVRASLHQPHTLDSLATTVLMSRRTFTRHFRQLTGCSVQQWLLAERLARAQQLLESTSLSMGAIADACGFGSDASLRQHFRLRFGVTPGQWRQTFAANLDDAGTAVLPGDDLAG